MSLILQALKKAARITGKPAAPHAPAYLKSFGFSPPGAGGARKKVRRILTNYMLPAAVLALVLVYGINVWRTRRANARQAVSQQPAVSAPSPTIPVLVPAAVQTEPEPLPVHPERVASEDVSKARPVPRPGVPGVKERPRAIPVKPSIETGPAAPLLLPPPTPEPVASVAPEEPVPPPVPAVETVVAPAAAPAGIDPNDFFKLAVFYQQNGELQRALALYSRVLDRNPLDSAAYNNVGLLRLSAGNVAEAIQAFRSAIRANPNYDKAHNNLGLALMQDGQNDEAAREFERALTLNPRNAEAETNLGMLARNADKPEEAKRHYLRALQIDPSSAESHYNLATVYEEQGEYSLAREHLRQFLRYGSSRYPDQARQVDRKIEELSGKLRP